MSQASTSSAASTPIGVATGTAGQLELLEAALARSGIGCWEIDLTSDRASYSDTWYTIAGWRREDWHAMPHAWRTQCHPEDLERADAMLRAHLAGELPALDLEYRLRTQNGDWRWLQNRGAIDGRNAAGQPLKIVGTTIDIDARKRAEQSMRENEFRYRTLAGLARACVYEYTFDATGNPVIQWGNEALRRIFGRGPEELGAGDFYETVHPEDRAAAAARISRQRAGEPTAGECRIIDASGEERRLHVMARPLVNAHGQVERVLAVARDITDTMRMREALEYSEFRYRAIAALTPGYAQEYRVNPDGTNELVWASEGFRNVYGCDHEEYNRRGGWDTFCHPEDLEASLARETAWSSGRQTEGVARVIGLDGHTRWLRCINRPLLDPISHNVTAIVGIGHDITDLMASSAAVRDSEQRFRMAVAAMSGLVYEADLATGEVLHWPGLEALLGYREGEVAHTMDAWSELIHPDDRRPPERVWDFPGTGEGEVVEFEYRARNRAGEYEHLVDRAMLMRDPDGRPRKLIGCTTNVSQRKQLERELLEISNREQQRIGNDLHDGLGQELTGISLLLRSLAQRLSREYPSAVPAAEQALDLVKGAIQSARTLAKGLSPVNLERGGLEFALRDLVMQLRRSTNLEISYRSRGCEQLSLDESSATHLYRIAQEAISNALRHAAARSVEVELAVHDQRVRLRIADDGRGFESGRDHGGMGLKIMHYRARMIAGALEVKPQTPCGTEVVCVCPQSRA
jgi:PAS domain S-box-containing protein